MSPRSPSLIERTRRAQLIDVAIAVVAEQGYGRASLQRIADGAGITKAAVLYHFSSKDAVVEAAREQVLEALVAEVGVAVGARVDAEDPSGAVAAYIRGMVGYFAANPSHTRLITEAGLLGPLVGTVADSRARWRPVADLLQAARSSTPLTEEPARALALIVSGGIDAIVAERLIDPSFDSVTAADALIELVAARLEA